MRRSSVGTGASALTTRALLLAASAAAGAIVTAALFSPGPLRAQATRAGAENTPHFLRIGKTYVNMGAISHAVSDPGFGLPPGTLQVYFGGQTYVNLYGDDADALRRLLDGGSTTVTGGGTKAADTHPAGTTAAPAAAAPAAAAPAAAKRPPAKKAVPAFEQP
ncbi:MAG: hypothetical protein P4L84_01470 [Isosphaeraceae bacterium]|nr:hypothetical protein [Isosphaeraceae bacterium]